MADHKPKLNTTVLLLTSTFLSVFVDAQRFPFQSAPMMKQSWCDLELARRNGTTILTDSLKGQRISVLYDKRDAEVDADLETGEIHGGYFVSIMREAARRGGFELDEDVAPDIPDEFGNWTEYMHWGVDHYDIFADWWAVTAETLDQHIVFPFGFLDMSKILVVKMPESDTSFVERAFSFLQPFHYNLWITVVAASIFAGFVFLLLERGHNELDVDLEQSSLPAAIMHSIWLSFIMLTGVGTFCPRTVQGKFFTFIWSFLVLLLVAAYTANLASYMVVKMTPSSPIQSLADANRLGTRLCIPDLYDEVFQRLQRQNPNLLERSTALEWGTDYFEPVRGGTCDAVLMTVFEWEAMRVQSAFHADCDMLYPGRPFWATGGGFPMRRDSSVHCSSFLNEVLGAIMAQMDNDGFMEEAYAQYLLRKEDVTCADTQAAEEGRELTVQNMMGGFGIFAVLSLLIVLWAFVVDRRSVHLFKPEVAAVSLSSPQRVAPMRIGRPSQVASSTGPGDRARTLSGRSMSQRVLEGLREPAAIPTETIRSNKVLDISGQEVRDAWLAPEEGEGAVLRALHEQREAIGTLQQQVAAMLQRAAASEERMAAAMAEVSRTQQLLAQKQHTP